MLKMWKNGGNDVEKFLGYVENYVEKMWKKSKKRWKNADFKLLQKCKLN
ncbi:MAG: hypothetical protein N2169_00695 [bacterium]|nr:hypothetical protein [bacterium]